MVFPSNDQPEFERRLAPLRTEVLQLRHRLEVVEAVVEVLNPIIAEIAGLGLLSETILIGNRIASRRYALHVHREEADISILAALSVPHGFGVLAWDSESYGDCLEEDLEAEARVRFVPFDDCELADRARLLPEIDPLVTEFLALLDL